MKLFKRWGMMMGLVLALALWIPYPCFQAPCTSGRGDPIQQRPQQTTGTPATIRIDMEHIHKVIQDVLHGNMERMG